MTCARCGKTATADKLVYSRHTNKHYCLDQRACDRRVKRLKTGGAIFDRGFFVP